MNFDTTKLLPYRELFDGTANVKTKDEANEYLAALVEYYQAHGKDAVEALRIAKFNVGYYAGYFSSEARNRVYELFEVNHPVLDL